MPAGPNVGLSQDNLFFPLPIATPIENILQITNKEAARVAFKVRSTIRNRYCVKPSVGFLHPKEEAVVKFLLDPSSMVVDGHEPNEETQDFFFIDFAFVEKDDAELSSSAFWKTTKQRDVTRRKLQCLYPSKKAVPESLVMRIETPKLQRVPSKIISNSLGPENDKASVEPNKQPAVVPAVPAPAAAAAPVAVPAPAAAPASPSAAVSPPTAVARANVTQPEQQVVKEKQDNTAVARQEPFLTKFLFFTIPVPLVVVLIVASFVLALIEENTWLTNFLRSLRGGAS